MISFVLRLFFFALLILIVVSCSPAKEKSLVGVWINQQDDTVIELLDTGEALLLINADLDDIPYARLEDLILEPRIRVLVVRWEVVNGRKLRFKYAIATQEISILELDENRLVWEEPNGNHTELRRYEEGPLVLGN